ncbi:MAG: phenylacetate--CoA ligase [Phycisphaerae bacterium]|nr:phenylacetate--CoA ligase [Phycisphaerae bacterium]NIP55012.1 phenylacetate--CoA ligase [Phycisphaerae bacterium]NIX31101.1 hypothetical protein [Phycisphaerae bacterium]
MLEHVERLSWSREQVLEHQTKQLRKLLALAKERSKYYGEVLADVDVSSFNPEDLPSHTAATRQNCPYGKMGRFSNY